IWYPRTTGIWQTVWMEVVPAMRIASVQWSSDVADWSIRLRAHLSGAIQDHRLAVRLRLGDRILVDDLVAADGPYVSRTFYLEDSGIDDARNELLWWPHAPNLIDAELALRDGSGETIDRVACYTAMRAVGIAGNRFVIN